MKEERITIYTKSPKSLIILTDLLKLHQYEFDVSQKEENLFAKYLPQSKCLIVDSFITSKLTGIEFLMRNIKKLEDYSLFVFRTHHLSVKEEAFISEYKINILPKPIFPMMVYKRLSQVLQI